MAGVVDRENKEFTYEEMCKYLQDPSTRISDMRIVSSFTSWTRTLQVLGKDGVCYFTDETEYSPTQKVDKVVRRISALDLFKVYYDNSPRNNPVIYGLLDTPQPIQIPEKDTYYGK